MSEPTTIAELYTALQPFLNSTAGTLILPASSITDWTDIHGLLNATMAAQTLTITGITSFPAAPTGNTIRYQGQAGLFPWTGDGQSQLSTTATFTIGQNGSPQLLIRAEVSAGSWRLSDSLSGLNRTDLANVVFASGLFMLTTQPVTVSDFSATVQPYLGFRGMLETTGPFALGQLLLPSPQSRLVEGTVDLSQGAMPLITLNPVGGAPITLAGIAFEFGAQLSTLYQELPYYDPDDPSRTTITSLSSSAALLATLAFGAGAPLRLSLQVLPASDFYSLIVREAAMPLSSWAELEPLSAGINLGTLIPAEVPPAVTMHLRQLELTLQFPDASSLPTVTAINFDVMMDVGDWALLPNGILTVQHVGGLMTVMFGADNVPYATGQLYSDFTIVDELAMTAALSIPQLMFTADLQPGISVSVESLMAAVMDKLTGHSYAPPVEMEISRLEMSVDIPNRSFGFGTDILTDWQLAFGNANGGTLITLSFQGISFDIDYDGQLLQATITAYAGINEGLFYFTAVSPGDGVGWAFGGGLMAQSSISVTKLLLAFMYPSGSIPGGTYGIPDLVIDKLTATLATDIENNPVEYTFEGGLTTSWNFSVFPDGPTLTMAAVVSLHGTRQAEPVAHRLMLPGRSLLPAAIAPAGLVGDDTPWQISGSVRGTFSLYNLLISAGYEFSPANSALSFGIWYKERGIQATLTQQVDKDTQEKQRILTIRFGDLSFGEILEYLINLALPGSTRRLSSPWDVLYQLNFKNLSLIVNLTTSAITVTYTLNLDLTFAYFTSISLRYQSVNGEGRVYIELDGQFLGQSFGGDDGEPLAWDVLNDPAPSVPGNGPSLLDLRYVGFGQHLALSVPVADLDTVDKVLTALRASMKPVTGSGNPLTDPASAGLRYDGNSNWIFGLDATILNTVSLSAVFFDPTLYGGVISLTGERAGGLAGLRFELLYRKITDDIGELSADLRVPDMFRHLEFGEVSITLGLIHVDIYTNGNFRVDLGFPHSQDFSQSFAVEVFPFVGEGGFYFAYLTGATSDRVPPITNGVFSPVIEAGVGLAIGLGKDFQAGPLKAGLKVEVFGIFEGVYAPFNPYDRSIAPDAYYWIQGTAGIVGTLYGSVDFVVIKAEVSIVARASVTFVLQAHRPSLIELRMSVTAKAKIKIIFFTVHFSFSFTLEESFTLGSASSTPWIEGSNSRRQVSHRYLATALSIGAPDAVLPLLRQQRHQAPVRRLTRLRHARLELPSLLANPQYRSLHQARLSQRQRQLPNLVELAVTAPAWPPLPVFGEGNQRTARLQFLPMFTVADPAGLFLPSERPEPISDPAGNQTEIVLGFIAENYTDPAVHGPSAVATVNTDHLHHADEQGVPALATMVETFFRWAAQAGAGKVGADQLPLLALQDLLAELSDPAFQQATFGYSNLSDQLADSLFFEIAGYPSGPRPTESSGTLVPVLPPLVATVQTGPNTVTRDYTSYQPIGTPYATNLTAYFQQLLTNATSGVAQRPAAGQAQSPQGTQAVEVSADSMAELIFGEYFALLTQSAVQAAIALLQSYPVVYPGPGGQSLDELAGDFATLSAPLTLARGQRLVDLAMRTGHHPDQLAAMNPLAAAGDSTQVDVPVGVTPLSIAEDNPAAILATGLSFPMPPLPYQVRSGQSLQAVAAAVPDVSPDTPITATGVGTASQAITGLLRAGQPMQIPSFSYQPVAGDTQNFLVAFWQVRNTGTFGIERLDWYSQAISTLNPDRDWSRLAVGSTPVVVPAGYLDSTPATAAYQVHDDDTLDRIAGYYALFQAMDNTTNPPVTAPVTVPAMTHPITAVDTFASLVEDFTGLQLTDLIEANAAGPVLQPLAVLVLPAFTVLVPAGQTLASLAAGYDLSLADLVDLVAALPAVFTAADLAIRDVPSRSVDEFITELTDTGQLNMIAGQLSNFLAHGLRAPAPTDTDFTDLSPQQVLDGDFTGDLYGLVDLIGQQFSWPDQAIPVQLSLTHGEVSWLSFLEAETVADPDAPVTELVRAINPGLAHRPVRAGQILATGAVTELDLTIDQASFGSDLPSTTVTLHAQPPIVLPNFEQTAVHYNFQVTQHWQAGSRPALPAGPSDSAPGEPSLWPLPANLGLVAATGSDYPFGLRSVPLSAAPGTEGGPLSSYCWAIQIPIAISRIADPNDPGDTALGTSSSGNRSELGSAWLDGVYLVRGASASDTERLYDLWTYLAAGTDTGQLYLLYPPNATGGTPNGYASDQLDPAGTVLLKTNLSTVTRDPSLARLAADPPSDTTYSAPISQPVDFLTLLWQASVVVEGGFYLRYDAAGSGLPDSIFDETGRASLQVLCLLTSQAGSAQPGGPLLALNNVAVINDNIDASAVQLYAVRTDADAPMTRTATVPPGSVGFEITRLDPAPPVGTDPTPEQLAGMLYGLVGYQIQPGTGFLASNEAVPQGPIPPDDDQEGDDQQGNDQQGNDQQGDDQQGNDPNVIYRQVLSAFGRADQTGQPGQANPWLPPATRDPYAGISATAAVLLSFAVHDVFGNRAVIADPLASTSAPDRYTDRLAGLGDWPSTSWSYGVAGQAPMASLQVHGSLQANSYLPDPQVSSDSALRTASGHSVKLAESFYQLSRPGLSVSLDSTLTSQPQDPGIGPLIGYLSSAYCFTSQLAGLTIKTHQVSAGQTLGPVAGSYAVAAADLLRDNLERAADAVFASTVTLPAFGQVKHGETLDAFAGRSGLSPVELLQNWGNANTAIVPAGVNLIVTATSTAIVAGYSLADYAAAAQCAVGDLARANAAVAGLISDGVSLRVNGVQLNTSGSTFESLVTDFANLGVSTDAAAIATANQNVVNIFSTAGVVSSFTVDRWLSALDQTVAATVSTVYADSLESFCTLNGALAGLLAQDTRLQVAQNTVTAPSDSLRHLLEQTSGITIADFAAANLGSQLAGGCTLVLPALLEQAKLASTPYRIQPAMTFGSIAGRFAVTAQVLGEQVQDIPAVLVADQPVTVAGFPQVRTGAQDGLASLLARYPDDQRPSLAQLVDAITDQAGLMLAGAALICPVPLAGSGSQPISIQAVAGALGQDTDALSIAKCNAALIGFLKQGATFSVGGHDFAVAQWQTLANTLGIVNARLDSALGYDAFLTAMLDQAVVDPASKALLRPVGVSLSVLLPATPAVTGTITELGLTATISRPVDQIDPNFAGVAEVQQASTVIPPETSGEPATLTGFASSVADAYQGALWVGIAAASEQGVQRQYVIRFDQPSEQPTGNAIREVRLGSSASYLGLPPLSNSLISRTADIRGYQSGGTPPFSLQTQALMFQAVDVTEWATDLLATIDLALSPSYATAGYHTGTGPISFSALVAAKASLASKIAGQLMPVEVGDSALDPIAATAALEQLLRTNLSAGYNTDAVVQVPSTVQASFASTGSDAGGHRFTGKIDAVTVGLDQASTLSQLATRYTVSVDAITDLLAATTNILATGTVLRLGAASWTIAQHDSLAVGIATLQTSPETFSATFAGTAPLFRDGVALTIDGFTATVSFGDTLNTMADALDISLSFLAVANQQLSGLLTGTVYLLGQPIQITEQTSSLAGLAQAQQLSVPVLASLIADQAVLTEQFVMHIVRWVPEYSLTTGKIDLDTGTGALTVLLSVKNRAHYRRLMLNLGFGINALEYAIEPAEYVDGYQSSKWLHLVNPLPDSPARLGGAVVSTGIGQLDIPIALRAYPATPRLANQSAQATYTAEQIAATGSVPERIAKAEAWSYYAGFELQLAAQDSASITIGLNYAPATGLALAALTGDPFPALAEYASNAAAIKADLVTLIQPAGQASGVSSGESALAALADLATRVAGSWGFVASNPDVPIAGDGLVPSASYQFGLQTRTRSGDLGEPLMAALVLIRQPGTDSWGPGNSIPLLGYLDDDGQLRQLTAPTPPVGPAPQTLSYSFTGDVADSGRRTYVIWYDDLNVIDYQNARASLTVTRNQNLAPGKTTNPEFVYQTPTLTFTNLAVPGLQWDQSLLFGTGAVTALPTALGQVFGYVLGDPPTAAAVEQKLSGNYGYRLVAAGDPDSPLSPQDLVSLTPIFYRPNFEYTDTVPADTGAAVLDWFSNHRPQPGNVAFLSLELQLFSIALPDRQQPIMRFGRLDYQLTGLPSD